VEYWGHIPYFLNVKFIRSNIPEKEANSIRYYTRTKTGRPFDSEVMEGKGVRSLIFK
jgi:hypothetical protein